MSDIHTPRPIPAVLADTTSVILAEIEDDGLSSTVARLVERAYAEGYADGHRRGRTELRDRQNRQGLS